MKKFNLKKLLSKKMNRKQRRIMIMFLTKLGFTNLPVSERVTKATRIVNMMTGNPSFATPVPALASITTLKNALQAAEAAMDGSELKTEQRDIALAALTQAMRDLQAYVENTASGDVEKILSSGFEVRNPRTPVGILGPVTDLTVQLGEFPGSVILKWKPIQRKLLYVVQASNTPLTPNWDTVSETSKAKVTLNELPSGQTIYFRIACMSSAGLGPWSEVISIRVY